MKKLKLLFVGMLVLGFAGAGYGQACNVQLNQGFGPSSVWLDTDTIEYFITLEIPADKCNMTDVNIMFYRPDDTGVNPSDICGDSTGGTMVISGLTLTSGGGVVTIDSGDNAAMSYDVSHADEDSSGNLFAYYCIRGIVQGIVPQRFQDEKPIPNTVIHPAIDIEKDPNRSSICEGSDTLVSWTYTVTNPGDVDLNDVVVEDTDCSPVNYVSGDTGDDGILETDETWIYECNDVISTGLTNTATVTANDVLLDTAVEDSNDATVLSDNPVCGPFTGDLEPDCNETGYMLCISASGGAPPYTYEWTSSDDVNWPITGGADTNCITYNSGPSGSSATFSVVITDEADCNVLCEQPMDCIPEAGDMFCTFTQGFWGNKNGKFEGETTEDLLDDYFGDVGSLTIGAGSNQLTLYTTSCLLKRMPAGGTPRCLDGLGDRDDTCASSTPSWLRPWLMKGNKKGARYNNVLMGQIIALTLNVWVDPNLGGLELNQLEGGFCTQGEDPYDWQCFDFPDDLDPVDVDGLLDLANDVLGCENGETIQDIYSAVTAINEGFDECRTLVPCIEVCYDGIDNDCNSLTLDCGGGDCPNDCPD
jgi:hypothetical protein